VINDPQDARQGVCRGGSQATGRQDGEDLQVIHVVSDEPDLVQGQPRLGAEGLDGGKLVLDPQKHVPEAQLLGPAEDRG